MQEVGDIFTQVQQNEGQNIPNDLVFKLIELYEKSQTRFIISLEQCYLKILKYIMGQKVAAKRKIDLFEKLTEKLFITLYQQHVMQQAKENSQLTIEDVYGLFQKFLHFFSVGVDASNLQVKVFCCRIIAILLKQMSKAEIQEILDVEVAKNLINGAIFLMRQKTGIKSLGIKISSFLQFLENEEIKSEINMMKKEILKCMCADESKEIRKLALTNLILSNENFSSFVQRTRDLDPDIRITIYKKLIKEKIHLSKLKLADIYKIVYDGISSREQNVKEECFRYLYRNFEDFDNSQQMELEGCIDQTINVESIRIQFQKFLSYFQIEYSLLYPHIYNTISMICQELAQNYFQQKILNVYVKYICENLMPQKGKQISVSAEEIFFLRCICQLMQEKPNSLPELFQIIDDNLPTSASLVQIIDNFHTLGNILATQQILLISQMLINCDEIGRIKLQDQLKKMLIYCNKNTKITFPNYNETKSNDVFEVLNQEITLTKKIKQSHYETAIIIHYDDLILLIVQILSKLLNDQKSNFNTFIIQTIHETSDLADNEEIQNQILAIKNDSEHCSNKYEEIQSKIAEMQKSKQKQKQMSDLQLEADVYKQKLSQFEQEIYLMEENKDRTNIRCLLMASSLLKTCKIQENGDPQISQLLNTFVSPLFKCENNLIRDLVLECLALFVFLDKSVYKEYFQVFVKSVEIIDFTEEPRNSEIISLKAIFDCSMIERDDHENFQNIFYILMNTMLQGNVTVLTICIEGFTRLLYNDLVQNQVQILMVLLFIWHDFRTLENKCFEAIQILSFFFKNYVAQSLKNLENFEKSLEQSLNLAQMLQQKYLGFNHNIFKTDVFDVNSLHNLVRIGIGLLNYGFHQQSSCYDELMEKQNSRLITNRYKQFLAPQERFFGYLCKLCGRNQNLFQFFEKIVEFFDFFQFQKNKQVFCILQDFIQKFLNISEQTSGFKRKKFISLLEIFEEKIGGKNQEQKVIDESQLNEFSDCFDQEIQDMRTDLAIVIKNFQEFKIVETHVAKQDSSNSQNENDSDILSQNSEEKKKPRKKKQQNEDLEIILEEQVESQAKKKAPIQEKQKNKKKK